MDLLNYLNEHFYNKTTLLALAKINSSELQQLQQQQVMPKASYTLELGVSCDSFFGPHIQTEHLEYYAKGYVSWIGLVQTLKTQTKIYQTFSDRYSKRLKELKQQGHQSDLEKLNQQLEQHIAQEWQHFLAGTYGLCTKSGLPEDIASKEFSIAEIQQLTEKQILNETELKQLTRAVDLLDQASALFAPHERTASSRQRLINEVRKQYKL